MKGEITGEMRVFYIYAGHMTGSLYFSETELDYYECLYCETCGDSDSEIGAATTKDEAFTMIKDHFDSDFYSDETIRTFVDSMPFESNC